MNKEEGMTELERTKRALEVARIEIANRVCGDSLKGIMNMLDAIINPPPEMEEVEVEQYTVITPNGGCLGTYPTPKAAESVMHDTYQLVPLTGTFKRPVPQKVERSVSVEVEISKNHIRFNPGFPLPVNDEVEAPFKEAAECWGKRGTLTFTWTEEQP